MRDDGNLDIICKENGSHIGGHDINNAFFQAIREGFEGDVMNVAFSDPTEVLEMQDDFEQKKVNLSSTKSHRDSISLKIPADFRDGLLKKKISLTKEAEKKGTFKIVKDKLYFYPLFIKDVFFKETISRITTKIEEVVTSLLRTCNVNIVVLVGGLSESRIVVSQIKETLGALFPDIKVVVPTSPFVAVLSGAVSYGHNPDIIHSRKSPATFGIKTHSLFDSAIHREDKIVWHKNGETYCQDIFSIHIKEAEVIILKEKQPQRTYLPLTANQEEARLEVFIHTRSSNMLDKVLYTTDEGCTKLGELQVKMPDTKNGLNRKIIVSFTYGTEIDVSATDETSGESVEVKLEFQNELC